MRTIFVTSSGVALALAFVSTAAAEAKRPLKLRWKPKQAYVQEVKVESQVTTPAGAMDIRVNMEMDVAVQAESGGSVDVKVTYGNFDVKAKMGVKELPLGDLNSTLKGQSLLLTYGGDGELLNIKGAEELTVSNPMAASLVKKETLKQAMGQAALLGVPKGPVGPGDKWDVSYTLPTPGMSVSFTGQYTYEKDEMIDGRSCARLLLVSKVTPSDVAAKPTAPLSTEEKAAADMMKSMGITVTKGEMSGVSFYDWELGNVVKSTVTSEMVMSMKSPKDGSEMDMPVKQKVESTLQAKK